MLSFMWWIVVGLIAGSLAKLFVRGRQPLGCLMTICLGLLGSFVGGFISSLIFGPDPREPGLHASGLILSTAGAVILLAGFAAIQQRRIGGP